MTATPTFYEADGVTPASRLDWGTVSPGQKGATLTRIIKNDGDTAVTNPKLVIRTLGAVDAEAWITGTVNGQTFTAATPLTLPAIAPSASVTVTFDLTVPADAPLTDTPLMAYPGLEYDGDS